MFCFCGIINTLSEVTRHTHPSSHQKSEMAQPTLNIKSLVQIKLPQGGFAIFWQIFWSLKKRGITTLQHWGAFRFITAVNCFAGGLWIKKLNKLPLDDQDFAGSGFTPPCQKFLSVLNLRCLFMVFVLKC